MVFDARDDEEIDTCFLLSSDSDFVPAIKLVRAARKKLVLVSPNADYNKLLAAEANDLIILEEKTYEKCQLPERVDAGDRIITRPEAWS